MVGKAVVNIRTERTVEGGGLVFRHYYGGPPGEADPSDPFFDGGHYLPVHGQTAHVAAPGDACVFEVSIKRAGKDAPWLGDADR